MNRSVKSIGRSASDERRNLRRVAIAVSLLALAALGNAARADEGAEEDTGLAVNIGYTGDVRRNTTGGMQVGTAYSDMFDLGATWTTDSLFSGTRFTSMLSVKHLGGGDITSDYVGDLHGLNNIEAPDSWRLYEFWSQFDFGGRANTSLRMGLLDLNVDFDAPVTSAFFIGPVHGIGTELSQTGGNGPAIFPVTGLGIRVSGNFNENVHWRVGAFEGTPGNDDEARFVTFDMKRGEGELLIGEMEYVSERVNKISLGLWSYTAEFERLDAGFTNGPQSEKGNHGVYALVDLPVAQIGPARLDGSMRLGIANEHFNPIEQCLSATLVMSHPFENRPDDAVGFGVAYGRTGEMYRTVQTLAGIPAANAETTYELTYRASITDWMSLVPTVQFVSHPGADLSMNDAWVVGLRFELSHEKSWPMLAQRNAPATPSVVQAER